jgi:DNA modification methylase
MRIIQGDSLEVLKTLPDESVDCVITSPPYWALRDYGCEGQLGLEPTFQEYIDKLCNIFDEVKRVLKKEGTCWVNIGDTYMGNSSYSEKGRQGFGNDKIGMINKTKKEVKLVKATDGGKYGVKDIGDRLKCFGSDEVKDKCLCQIPSRFAIEMTNRGWILRNEIIWHKPNCMPSSAEDRFTVDFEKVFFFVKSKKYYFEQILEPYTAPLDRWGGDNLKADNESEWDKGTEQSTYRTRNMRPNEEGRNKRTVWSITTKGFSEAHFATYPEALVEPMIKSGCPQFVCSKCGKAREKIIIDTGERKNIEKYTGQATKEYDSAKAQNPSETKRRILESMSKIKKEIWTDCGCNSGWKSGIVLDPFSGSGTTGRVAIDNGREYIGIELNPEYIKIQEKRLMQTSVWEQI